MYGIEILVDEHEHILDLISCIKQSCYVHNYTFILGYVKDFFEYFCIFSFLFA